MDPDETLSMIRDLAKQVRAAADDELAASYGSELADAIEILDEWLSKGGFLPDAWERAKQA